MTDKTEDVEFVVSDEPLDGRKVATEQDVYLFALSLAGLHLLETTKKGFRDFYEAHPEFAEFANVPDNFDKAIDKRIKFFKKRIKKFCDTKAVNAITKYIVADTMAKRMEEIESKENGK